MIRTSRDHCAGVRGGEAGVCRGLAVPWDSELANGTNWLQN